MMPSMARSRTFAGRLILHPVATALTWAVLLMLALAPLAAAQDGRVYEERTDGVHILDDYGVFNDLDQATVEDDLVAFFEETGIDIVVYTQKKARPGVRKDAQEEAAALLEEWGVGGETGRGAVMFWNIKNDGSITRNGVALGDAYSAADAKSVDEIVNTAIRTPVSAGDWLGALNIGVIGLQEALIADIVPTPAPRATPRTGPTAAPLRTTTASGTRPTSGWEPEPGPPFPDPFDETGDHFNAHVGLEQRESYLAKRGFDVKLGQVPFTP